MGILEYKDIDNSSVLLPYVNRLMREINGSGAGAEFSMSLAQTSDGSINKAGAGELAVAIDKIANRVARDLTVENLFHAAGSVGLKAGVNPRDLQARQRALGLSEDDLVSLEGNTQAAVTVFNGGPHIKIM